MHAVLAFGGRLRLRLSGANLLGQAIRTRSLYADGAGSLLRTVDTGSYRTLRITLEGPL